MVESIDGDIADLELSASIVSTFVPSDPCLTSQVAISAFGMKPTNNSTRSNPAVEIAIIVSYALILLKF